MVNLDISILEVRPNQAISHYRQLVKRFAKPIESKSTNVDVINGVLQHSLVSFPPPLFSYTFGSIVVISVDFIKRKLMVYLNIYIYIYILI